jgi:hypothetical protein
MQENLLICFFNFTIASTGTYKFRHTFTLATDR